MKKRYLVSYPKFIIYLMMLAVVLGCKDEGSSPEPEMKTTRFFAEAAPCISTPAYPNVSNPDFLASNPSQFSAAMVNLISSGGILYIDATFTVNITSTFDFKKAGDFNIVVKAGNTLTLDGQNGLRIINIRNGVKLGVYGKVVFQKGNTKNEGNGGGAVRLNPSSTGIFVDCEFKDNQSTYFIGQSNHNQLESPAINGGGAIKNQNGNLEIYNCKFINNHGTTGGAISNTSANLIASNCDFIGNESLGGKDDASSLRILAHGAALRLDRAPETGNGAKTVQISCCLFEGNKAHELNIAGANYNASTVEIWSHADHSPVENNNTLNMWDCEFKSNTQVTQRYVLSAHGTSDAQGNLPVVNLKHIRIYNTNAAERALSTSNVDDSGMNKVMIQGASGEWREANSADDNHYW